MVVLHIENITKSYAGHSIFHNLNLTWCEFGVLAITGENGTGKSTLLSMIAGLLESDQGRIYINEQEQGASNDEYKKLVAYVPDKSPVYDFIQGAEFLNLICSIRKLNADAYCKFISRFKLEEYLDLPFAQMSFGTTKKFLLIAALMTDAPVLILDEPNNGLDQASLQELKDILIEQSKTKLILLSCHDPAFRAALNSRIVDLEELKTS